MNADNKKDTSVKRILIVDDDLDMLILVNYLLKSNGYVVKVISDAGILWQALTEFQPDLILMDVIVNKHSGFELCKTITSSKDAPIVILFSGINISESEAKKNGASAHMNKPFHIDTFYGLLNKFLEKSILD